MTRLLFLTESFHPVLGGGETHIRRLASRLAASGMPSTVLTRRGQSAWPALETIDGVRVVRVGPAGPARTGKYAMVGPAWRALLREARGFDVLVVRGTRVLGLPGVLAARWLGKAAVLQPEVNGEMTGEVYTWGTPLDRPPLRRLVFGATAVRNRVLCDADGFVAMSHRIQREMLDAGVCAEKVWHLPHGVDTGHFRPATPDERRALRLRLGLPAEALIIIYTGRLLRGKGLETLIEAFATLASTDDRLRLLLVGSGTGQALSVEGELRESVRRAGLEPRVLFTGSVPDVADHLRASDIFAFPSVFEALGLSLIEAAACGLPSVGSRTGGIVDVIVEGRSGLLFEPGDVAGLVAALRRLLADPALRAALGGGARQTAREGFDLETSVERYHALFDEVARRRSR